MRNYFKSGEFSLGVNYWASHAGTATWKNWNAEIVDSDLATLKAEGVSTVRVFPLWEDFQPITALLGYAGNVREVTRGEEFLGDGEEDSAGVSEVAMRRFEEFLSIAKKHGTRVIVSLITGWMSGRCFFPPALRGRNVITDPFCLKWEAKFVKYFVRRFKSYEQIIAWELGNECNCLAPTSTEEEAYAWTSFIVNCVKSEDTTRPMLSGMHSLAEGANFNIENQGELCDVLTVHPYMLFTANCALDRMLSPRAIEHTAAELSLYSDLGNKPCLVEEIGTLGDSFGSRETAAAFVRANLFNSWAHDGLGMFWWCAFDQTALDFAPYDWDNVERELGLNECDRTPKPVANSYREFADFLRSLPFVLPPRRKEAACLLYQHDWDQAFGAFLCSKRAGFDLKFSSKKNFTCPGYSLYVAPGTPTPNFMLKRAQTPLLERVKEGATLLITYDEDAFAPFDSLVGCKSLGRSKATAPLVTQLNGKRIEATRNYAIILEPTTAKVIARDQDGNPCLTVNDYGKGKVIFFAAALEKQLATTPTIASERDCALEEVYRFAAAVAGVDREVSSPDPRIDVTLHDLPSGEIVVIAANYTAENIDVKLNVRGSIASTLYGKIEANGFASIPAADALVFTLAAK